MENTKLKSSSELIVYILAILGLIIVINYVGTQWFRRIDMTESKQYSVSDATKKVLKSLDDIINVYVYFSEDLPPHMHKTVTDVKDIISLDSIVSIFLSEPLLWILCFWKTN